MEAHFYTSFLNKIYDINNKNEDIGNFWVTTNSYKDVKKISNSGCKIRYSAFPTSIINLNKNWKRLKLNWYVLKC